MNDQQQTKFEGWAVVELFGHNRAIGFVTTEYFGPAALFRIDTPALPEREFVLTRPCYTSDGDGSREWTNAGAKVRRGAVPGSSQLIGPSSIYRITPCTEETARAAIEELIERPLILLEPPPKTQPLQVAWPASASGEEDD